MGKKKLRQLGLHAIALAGYNIPKNRPQKYSKQSGTLFAATGIERLYAHDDQVGPFSRIRVDRKARLPLGTSWPDGNRIRGNIFFDPQILLVPLYHKIRVPIMSMISIVLALDLWIETARIAGIVPLATRVEWDVFLIENARLKSGLFEDQQVLSDFRSKVLMSDMPRYIWRVSAATNNIKQFDILFDATDLLQGGHVLGVLPYVKDVCVAVAAIAQNPHAMASIKSTGNRGLELTLSWFADNAALF